MYFRLERAVLVLREEFKKHISREQGMRKYIQKLRRQQSMKSNFTS